MTETEGTIALVLAGLMALLALGGVLVYIDEPDPPSRLTNILFGSALICGAVILIVIAPEVFFR
jgi:hypothetical protein